MMNRNVSQAKPRKTRSSTPRVRTGCETCRKRHVKCDEAKPSCAKCIQAGWKCDGYADPATATRSHVLTRKTAAPPPMAITTYLIPFRVPGSQKDRQLLHYFCVQGSEDISGFGGSEFWARSVLQESHRDGTVRQALLALSSLHLDYTTNDLLGPEAPRAETLTSYHKALRMLGKRIAGSQSAESVRAALVCCVLFCSFESTLGNSEGAMRHLHGGLKLLAAQPRGPVFPHNHDLDPVAETLERMDLQATLFNDDRIPISAHAVKGGDMLDTDDTCPENVFTRMTQAQHALVGLQNQVLRLLICNAHLKFEAKETIPPDVTREKDNLTRHLETWSVGFEHLHASMKHDSTREATLGTQILLTHHHVSRMLLAASLPADPMVFGAVPNAAASEVLELAEDFLKGIERRNTTVGTTRNPRRNLSLETGVVAPLFLLAMKCSDRSVCQRAAGLLAASRRREGLYDAQAMAAIITKIQDARDEVHEDGHGSGSIRLALEYSISDKYGMGSGGVDRLINYT